MDLLCSEYGWTLEQAMGVTARQAQFLMRSIGKRNQIDLAMQASLHGLKLPFPSEGDAKAEFSAEEDAIAELAVRDAMKRKLGERNG